MSYSRWPATRIGPTAAPSNPSWSTVPRIGPTPTEGSIQGEDREVPIGQTGSSVDLLLTARSTPGWVVLSLSRVRGPGWFWLGPALWPLA